MKLKRTKTEVRDLVVFALILIVIVIGLVAYVSYINFSGLIQKCTNTNDYVDILTKNNYSNYLKNINQKSNFDIVDGINGVEKLYLINQEAYITINSDYQYNNKKNKLLDYEKEYEFKDGITDTNFNKEKLKECNEDNHLCKKLVGYKLPIEGKILLIGKYNIDSNSSVFILLRENGTLVSVDKEKLENDEIVLNTNFGNAKDIINIFTKTSEAGIEIFARNINGETYNITNYLSK